MHRHLITKIIYHIRSALSYILKLEAYFNGEYHNGEAVRALSDPRKMVTHIT